MAAAKEFAGPIAGGDPLPLQLVEPRRLYRQIADQIAGLIAAGEFKPGSRLPAERELATKLGDDDLKSPGWYGGSTT